jgi:hypothetical protein
VGGADKKLQRQDYNLRYLFFTPVTRVGIFILLNNSHHYMLVEECTIHFLVELFENNSNRYLIVLVVYLISSCVNCVFFARVGHFKTRVKRTF